jgi:hypothetical protein
VRQCLVQFNHILQYLDRCFAAKLVNYSNQYSRRPIAILYCNQPRLNQCICAGPIDRVLHDQACQHVSQLIRICIQKRHSNIIFKGENISSKWEGLMCTCIAIYINLDITSIHYELLRAYDDSGLVIHE